jgi:hypothetical protein
MSEPAPVLETRPVVEEKAPPPPSTAPALTPLPPDRKKPDLSKLPRAPQIPSSKMPMVLGFLGLAACALLPIALFVTHDRMMQIMAYLAGAILLPFAPLAWLAGRRYEDRCIDLGFNPAGLGRAGRILGMTVTILTSLEGSVLAFLAAYRLISPGK